MKTFAFVLAALCVLCVRASAADQRWNILFVFADDWGRYASCYKGLDGRPTINDVVKTPNVDRVAREGVLFKNAFVNAPSCTPCRSSLLSGRYFFNTGRGAILNGAIWDSAIPSFPLLLRDAGYSIGKSYKVWSPGTPADAPIGGQEYAYEKHGRAPNNFSEEATARVEKGMTVAKAREEILAQVRGNFDDFLAARKPGQPWLYFFGPTTTHRTWIKGSGKKLWGIEPDSLKGRMPKFLPDVPEVREDVADYLGESQAVDAYVGELLKRLEETGEAARTLVVLSGDHGMPGVPAGKCNLYDHGVSVALVMRVPGGKGGRIVNDFVRLPDLAPTFMEVGGVKPPDGLYGRTLVPLLKSDKSGLIDPTRDWVITGRERHVATAREGNLPYPMRSLHTPEFVYIRNFAPDRWPMGSPKGVTARETPEFDALQDTTYTAFADMDASPTKAWLITHRDDTEWKWHYEFAFGKRPAEELYDLRKDPDQVKNVAADPAYAKQKQQLSERLIKLLTDAKDPRVTAQPVPFEQPPFTDVDAGAAKKAKGGKRKAGK
ncbi:MAG TPA: sulfatase [Verrucomicrobiae bacterium]|jgi:arylsulfatase A-like enzyme